MEASPVGFAPERYWTEEKERALITFFSSESSLFNHQLCIPQEVSVFTGLLVKVQHLWATIARRLVDVCCERYGITSDNNSNGD